MLTRDSCVVEVLVNLVRFCPVQDSHAGSDFRLGVVRANFFAAWVFCTQTRRSAEEFCSQGILNSPRQRLHKNALGWLGKIRIPK